MNQSPTRTRKAATFVVAGAVLAAGISCGSRTGLFLPDPAELPTESKGIDAGDAGPVPCVPGRFTFDLALTQLMLVIDRSGSMALSLDGRDDIPRRQRRWSILQDALRKTIVPFDRQIAMGAKFFPDVGRETDTFDPERACATDTDVAIPPLRGNATKIVTSFDVTDPRGGTPTAEALRSAAQYLVQQRSVARTIILATDGAPNCNGDLEEQTCVCTAQVDCNVNSVGRFSCLDDARSVAATRDIAEKQKIPVYVIGIGSTERPEFLRTLDAMAVAGGRPRPVSPRHYNVQSEDDLTTALAIIRDSVARCTYLTPSAPTHPDGVSVEVDGVAVPHDPSKQNGWDWVDKTYGELAFFGDACQALQGSDRSSVSGVVSCSDAP